MELRVLLFCDGLVGFHECFTIGWVCFHIEFFSNNHLDGLIDDEVFFCLLVFRSIGNLCLFYNKVNLVSFFLGGDDAPFLFKALWNDG